MEPDDAATALFWRSLYLDDNRRTRLPCIEETCPYRLDLGLLLGWCGEIDSRTSGFKPGAKHVIVG